MVIDSSTFLKSAQWAQRLESEEMSDAEWRAFESWLDESSSNRHAFEQVQSVWLSTSVDDKELAAILALQSEANELPSKSAYKIPFEWFKTPRAVFASVLVTLFLISYFVYFPITQSSGENDQVVIQTAKTESRRIELDDGTLFNVKPSSELTYQYSEKVRNVTLLKGEVTFDVTRNETNPFKVFAVENSIKVLGTSFSVKVLKGTVDIEVIEGLVSVEPKGAFTSLRLSVGNGITIEPDGRLISFNKASSKHPASLVFEDQKITDILKDLNRYFPKKLIAKSSYDQELYTGIIYLDSLDKVLVQLNLISDAEISFVD